MLRRVALVRTDVSKELSTSFIRVTRIGELATTLAVTSNRAFLSPLMKEALSSSETSVLTRVTWRNNPEDDIPHSHRRENLKSYVVNVRFSEHRLRSGGLTSCSLTEHLLVGLLFDLEDKGDMFFRNVVPFPICTALQ
jgi:hypothetical protein